MPLLHQDERRGGGGPRDCALRATSSRTIAELLAMDTMLSEPLGAPAVPRNECEWPWEPPGSPEVAQTPYALVPATCFPPPHHRAYASFSESAQPGGAWNGQAQPYENHNGTGHDHPELGIHDLVASLKGLTMVGAGTSAGPPPDVSPPPQMPCDTTEQWSMEPYSNSIQLRDEKGAGDSLHRRASFCGVSGQNGRAVLRWSGQLPARVFEPDGGFSSKLFLGGLPWDMSEKALAHELDHFGPLRVEWPERELGAQPRGFAYVTLESEQRVRTLLGACRRDHCAWYYRLHSRKMRTKEVQVIPWAVCDANWAAARSARLEATRTVFVGALHGMLSAGALAAIMNDLFSGVVYAGIDTDRHKYPIGSGRVTFDNVRSYVRAISAAFIEIHTDKFTKKVQIDPYLEDSMCSVCNLQQGPYFCREPSCFGYFCRTCWRLQHSAASAEHKALMRNSKSAAGAPACVPVPPLRAAPRPRPAAPRARPHSDHNGLCAAQKDVPGTPSPPTSGASGASGASATSGTSGSVVSDAELSSDYLWSAQ